MSKQKLKMYKEKNNIIRHLVVSYAFEKWGHYAIGYSTTDLMNHVNAPNWEKVFLQVLKKMSKENYCVVYKITRTSAEIANIRCVDLLPSSASHDLETERLNETIINLQLFGNVVRPNGYRYITAKHLYQYAFGCKGTKEDDARILVTCSKISGKKDRDRSIPIAISNAVAVAARSQIDGETVDYLETDKERIQALEYSDFIKDNVILSALIDMVFNDGTNINLWKQVYEWVRTDSDPSSIEMILNDSEEREQYFGNRSTKIKYENDHFSLEHILDFKVSENPVIAESVTVWTFEEFSMRHKIYQNTSVSIAMDIEDIFLIYEHRMKLRDTLPKIIIYKLDK